MSRMTLLWGIAAVSLLLVGAAFVLLRLVERQTRLAERVIAVRNVVALDATPVQPQSSLRLIEMLGRVLARSGLLPATTLSELEQTLIGAGFRQRNSLSLFIGAKLLMVLVLPMGAYLLLHGMALSTTKRMLGIGVAAIIGLLLPDMVVRRMRRAHLKSVELGLPDALDMLVICSEAGLGLEPGLERVAEEIFGAHPAVAAELRITSAELRIIADRRVALTNMGTRTGLVTLKRLGATLVQSLQYGTPLSQALRTLAAEMRYEMLMRFEAQAARLPVLLTVPMILFILPCIFIVVGGPAGLTVARTLIHH